MAAIASLLLAAVVGCSGGETGTEVPADPAVASEPARATFVSAVGPLARPPSTPCTRTVGSAGEARQAVERAARGDKICLASGTHGTVDLTNIDKPVDGRVIFSGVGKRATTIDGLEWAGSSGLIVTNLRSTGAVSAGQQDPAHHITFSYMNVSGADDLFLGIGSYDDSGQHHIVIERNYIHHAGEYAIRASGNAPAWTVRLNRIERVQEDYIQSGDPTDWVIDQNVMGPGDFNRPDGYDGHPDVWQTLSSGSRMRFTNNLVKDTNESLGFIFGTINDYSGFDRVLIRNNVFARVVYGVGETCQFSPGSGYVFEQNTLVDSGGCRWGGGEGQPWPDGRDYSIKGNILSEGSFLSCNNTPSSNSCDAFEAGSSRNKRGFDNFAGTRFYTPKGVPKNVGARLSSRDFRGYPFSGKG